MTSAAAKPLRFGDFELQAHERRLLRRGEPVALGARSFDVLHALAERPGRLVGKRELMDLVWPGFVVQENNLAAQVSALRKALGDEIITTVPGRGYRLVAQVAPAPDAPSAEAVPAERAQRTNLPAALAALLGRADDLDALGALVDAHRIVSVVGPGGIGKSLLTQHLLASRRAAYTQGVCWVELAPLADASALPAAVSAALGVDGGSGEPLAALVAAVAPLHLLLALDNAEHHLAGVAHLCAALHDAAPGVHIVVTSQAPLKLTAERVFRVGPLSVPAAAVPAARALQHGAVALFAERASAIDREFRVTEATAPTVIEVCRALDGLPLAIELAAARVPLLGLQRLASSMDERLRLLTASRNRAAPPRQRTLRAALEWSHGFLSADEQRVFRRLGVTAGSASLDLVEHVAGAGDIDRWAVLDALDALVDRSLVAVLDAYGDDAPRYRLLESPRAFALERLDAAGERDAVQRRHALAIAAAFDAAYDACFSGRVRLDDWMRRLGDDLDNAREAQAWARAAGEAEVELTIAATLLRALPPSLHAERMALADACEARVDTSLPAPLRYRVWIELSCAWADTRKPRSRDAAQRALEIARTFDVTGEGRFALYHALCRTASACAQAGDLASAPAPLAELRAIEDAAWPAQRLLWGAEAAQVVARMRGDAAETLRLSRRLLELDRARGGDASIALGNLIDHELAGGDARAAARTGIELVRTLEGTRHEYGLAFARVNLAAAWLALDDVREATPVLQAAWPQALAFDLPHVTAAYLALLAALDRRPRAAALLLGYAEAAYAMRGEACETNEAAAAARAGTIARAALGEAEYTRLRAEGASLHESTLAALAFATHDVEAPAQGAVPHAERLGQRSARLPVVDVSALVDPYAAPQARSDAARALEEAARRHGFFYAGDHGVDARLVDRLVELARAFFAQSEAEKMRLPMTAGGRAWRGYFPLGGELTSNRPDWKEGLYLGSELPPEHPRVRAGVVLHGPNLWPPIEGFRDTVLAYIDAMTRLGHALLAGIALGLGVPERWFREHGSADPLILLRLFNYPSRPVPAGSDVRWGVGEHTDYGWLTMLWQDDVGGLEVHTDDGWIAAPPIAGTFVCNIGDMLDRMTGGRLRSLPHRVAINRSGRDRLSIPLFFDPDFDTRIEPVPGCAAGTDDSGRRWDAANLQAFEGTYGDYVTTKIGRVFPGLKNAVGAG